MGIILVGIAGIIIFVIVQKVKASNQAEQERIQQINAEREAELRREKKPGNRVISSRSPRPSRNAAEDNILKEQGDILKKQDKQLEEMRKAQSMAKEGSADEAIIILERIMYDDGLIVNGVTWPFLLADIYYKNKIYDKAWKYLNFLMTKFPIHQEKILERQAKILRAEKKHQDALHLRLHFLISKYGSIQGYSQEDFIKGMGPYIKSADCIGKEEVLYALFRENCSNMNAQAMKRRLKEILELDNE